MPEENVFQLPTRLERLAAEINIYLNRAAANRAEWIEIQEGKCLRLAEARSNFRADIAFGQWCSANGFGDNTINDHDRSAAIAMGKEPQALRACLEATTRQSLQLIHREDFPRFANASKPTGRSSSRRRTSDDMVRARAAVRPLIENSRPINRSALAAELGVSVSTVHEADHQERGRLDALAEAPEIDPATLSMTAQAKLEAAIRQATRRLEQTFDVRQLHLDEEVRQKVLKEGIEYRASLAEMKERAAADQKWYRELIDNHKPLFSGDEFKLILMCLHPDGERTAERLADAFRLFNAKKLQLTGQK